MLVLTCLHSLLMTIYTHVKNIQFLCIKYAFYVVTVPKNQVSFHFNSKCSKRQ